MSYYTILGIQRSADAASIRAGYRRKALKFRLSEAEGLDAVIEFGRISEAYDVLMHPEWKALYDLYGEDVLKNGIDDEEGGRIGGSYTFDPKTDPMRIFKHVFATDNPYEALYRDRNQHMLEEYAEHLNGYQPPARAATKSVEFYCDLEDVFYGCTRTVSHVKTVKSEDGSVTAVTKELTIPIAPGEEDGKSYSFPKEGDVEPGIQPGTVLYVLRIRPHEKFMREGTNVVFPVDIPIHQAFLQRPIEIETLDRRRLTVLLPCVPTPGYRHVIKGEGMHYPDRTRVLPA